MSSTNTGYVVEGGGQRVDLIHGLAATPLHPGLFSDALPATSVDIVDDAGQLLVACGQPVYLTRCVLTRS